MWKSSTAGVQQIYLELKNLCFPEEVQVKHQTNATPTVKHGGGSICNGDRHRQRRREYLCHPRLHRIFAKKSQRSDRTIKWQWWVLRSSASSSASLDDTELNAGPVLSLRHPVRIFQSPVLLQVWVQLTWGGRQTLPELHQQLLPVARRQVPQEVLRCQLHQPDTKTGTVSDAWKQQVLTKERHHLNKLTLKWFYWLFRQEN